MKLQSLLPAITALVGFSIAWLAKPSGVAPAPAATLEKSPLPSKTRSETTARQASSQPRSKEVKAGSFPLADALENGPKTHDEARMLRLTEALGLSLEQQGSIIDLMEKVQATINGEIPVVEDLALRGKAIEEGLAKLLSPQQFAKFEEVRARERENRIEIRAAAKLTPAISRIDLSPEQRAEVMNRLRLHSKAELQSIPAAATLLFDNSMLPTGNKELSIDGVLALVMMGEPAPDSDPMVAYEKVQTKRRQEMEGILICFDGILTPGQMGQYQADMSEKIEASKRFIEGEALKYQKKNQ